jgi:hypothetical protein
VAGHVGTSFVIVPPGQAGRGWLAVGDLDMLEMAKAVDDFG